MSEVRSSVLSPDSSIPAALSLHDITADIKSRMQRSVADIIVIGKHLKYVKEEVLQHGEFMEWCSSEFGMERATVQRLLTVADRFEPNYPSMGNLRPLRRSGLQQMSQRWGI